MTNQSTSSVKKQNILERMESESKRHRFTGCMLGGAVGDALGAPVEFMTLDEIIDRFGPDGITEYAAAYGGLGSITDDTQMTLFTAEGLMRAWMRGSSKGIASLPSIVGHAYLRWLQTQGETPVINMDFGSDEKGWLFKHKELHSRRAPGNTCLSALRTMRSLSSTALNNSKGCGGVMRVAPVGLFAHQMQKSAAETFDLGTRLAAITHGHPTGSLTAGVFAVLIKELLNGESLPQALAVAMNVLRGHDSHEETTQAITKAQDLALTSLPSTAAIRQLGEGWVAEQALAISIYCALKSHNFEHGVILAVNHDGDSDSTGSIVGNLLGTLHGESAIPVKWLKDLELQEVIRELGDDLYALKDWNDAHFGRDPELRTRLTTKYPGV